MDDNGIPARGRAWRFVVMLAALSLLATGCGPGGPEESGPAAETEADSPTQQSEAPTGGGEEALEGVTFSAVPSTTSIALQVAKDQGFFEEEGIEAEIITFPSGAASEQAMVTGEVDFGGGGVGNSLLLEAAGEDVVNLALFQERSIFTLVVRDDLADEITSVENLEGRTVGISSPGSLTDFFTRLALIDAGLDPDNDVSLVATSGPDGHIAALDADQVEAQMTWEPGTIKITEELGLGTTLLDLRTDAAPPSIAPLVGSSLQALQSKVDEDPELAEAVTRAIVKADRAIADDPAVLAESLSEVFTDLPPELIDQIAEIEHSSFRPELTVEEVQAWIDAYEELEYLDEPVEAESVLDERFSALWDAA